jgi:hypothetical protein
MENINNDMKINYIEYNALQTIPDDKLTNENINYNIARLSEVPKWEINFESILFMRSLNKQNPLLLKQYLNQHTITLLEKLCMSIRSGLAKETIIFLGEILMNYTITSPTNDYIVLNKLSEILLHCTFNSKGFIRDESKSQMKKSLDMNATFVNNFDYCIELIDLMKNPKSIISDNAFEMYEMLFAKVIIDNKISNETWLKLIDKLDELYSKKREIYTKKATKIISEIINKIGKDVFMEILISLNKKEKFETYETWIKLSEKKSSSAISLKEFKKQQLSKKRQPQQQIVNDQQQQHP